MPKSSSLIFIQDHIITHKLRVVDTDLSEKLTNKRFLKLKGLRGSEKELLFEENSHLRSINRRSVEISERIQDGNRTETTQCNGMDENDLDKFEDEWSALWKPGANQKEIDSAISNKDLL